jgi:hypothetical protein
MDRPSVRTIMSDTGTIAIVGFIVVAMLALVGMIVAWIVMSRDR